MKTKSLNNKKALTTAEYIVRILLILAAAGILFFGFPLIKELGNKLLLVVGLNSVSNADRSFNKICGFEVKYVDIANELTKPSPSSCGLVSGTTNKWICLESVHLYFKIGLTNNNEQMLNLYPVAIVEKCEDEQFTKCEKIDEIGSLITGTTPKICSVPYAATTDCINSEANLWVDFASIKNDIAYYRIKPKAEAAADTCGNKKVEIAQKDDNMIFVTVYKDRTTIYDDLKTEQDCLTFSASKVIAVVPLYDTMDGTKNGATPGSIPSKGFLMCILCSNSCQLSTYYSSNKFYDYCSGNILDKQNCRPSEFVSHFKQTNPCGCT